MRKAELDEMRAILRAQAQAAPTPERKGLLGGFKSLLKKSQPASKRPTLNMTPLDQTPDVGQSAPAFPTDEATQAAAASVVAESDAPMLFLAPRRARFGLADEGARPVSAPRLSFTATSDADESFDVHPRRRGASLAATEAAGVGMSEILELHEMLSERMPQLLSRIDLDAKLGQVAPPAPAGSDGMAAGVGPLDSARAEECAAMREAWSNTAGPLASLRQDRSLTAARRSRLSTLQAQLTSHHAELEGDLHAVRRARSRQAA